MADDPRVLISSLRIRASSLRAVDALAVEHDWTRSQALRYLLGLGLAAHIKEHGASHPPPPGARPRPEPRPAPPEDRSQVQTHPKTEAGRKRDRP